MKLRLNKLRRGAPFIGAFIFSTIVLAAGAAEASAQAGLYVESPDISQWIAERGRRARNGQRERVRLPLVRRSDGWGCVCPEYYVGLSTANAGPALWIEPRFERPGLRLRKNTIVLAEGYFTGRRPVRDLRSGPDQPEELIYRLLEFRVTRVILLPPDHNFYDENSPGNRRQSSNAMQLRLALFPFEKSGCEIQVNFSAGEAGRRYASVVESESYKPRVKANQMVSTGQLVRFSIVEGAPSIDLKILLLPQGAVKFGRKTLWRPRESILPSLPEPVGRMLEAGRSGTEMLA